MTDSSSDSDSDLELLKQIANWDKEEKIEYDSKQYNKVCIDFFQKYENNEFTFRFRLTKSAVEDLLLEIYPFLKVTSKRNHGPSPLHQLLLTLRFYAVGTMLESVAEYIGVSKSSAGRIVKEVSAAIAKISPKYVHFHTKTEKDFYKIAGFPRVLGAIDCTHILMHSPESNFNQDCIKKSVTSMNVQAVCDAHLSFMNIIAGWPGLAHDSTIFHKSELRAQCENGLYGDRLLLGDNAYPCKPYLLTPVINPRTADEERYNDAHIQTRYAIERCFDLWKRRFPILLVKIRLSLENIQTIIIATAILHNICRQYNMEDIEPEVEPSDNITFDTQNIPESSTMNDYSERNSLIRTYFTS